jgi:serine/threonine protein kinase
MSELDSSPALSAYTIGEKIGEGGYSTVYLGTNKITQETVAIKVIGKLKADCGSHVVTEFKIQCKFECPYIVNIYDMVEEPDRFLLVMEYVPGGELFEAILTEGPFSEKDAAVLIQQILVALKVLHDNKVVHRDLKPENLLLTKDSHGNTTVKLADFGLAGIFSVEKMQEYAGSLSYSAPELVKNVPYTDSVDIWSLGCVVYVLLTATLPFYDPDDRRLAHLIARAKVNWEAPELAGVSALAKDFMSKMIRRKSSERISIAHALEHPWIRGQAPDVKLDELHKHLKIWNVKRKMVRVSDVSVAATKLGLLA